MIRIIGCLTQQHEPWLIAVAAIICAFGCFTTLSVLSRARTAGNNGVGLRWLTAASVTGGAAIWTTHFVAMLAYQPGFAVGYDIPLTFLSIAFAVLLTWIGFAIALYRSAIAGGATFGAAVGAMHYTGMAALRVPAHFHWDGNYVFISVATGIVFGAAALYLFTHRRTWRWRLGASVLMTLAIAGHHFSAMTALSLRPDPTVSLTSNAVMAPALLAVAVAGVMLVIAGIGLAGSIIDQHLAQRADAEAARLRAHVEELELTKAELNRALAEADAASEAKSRFLAAMSHELRTPLNAIIGFSDIMARELFGPHGDARYRAYAEDVRASGDRLLRLINDILDFSRIDSGHLSLQEDIVNLREIAAQAIGAAREQAEAAGVRIEPGFAEGPLLLQADARRVRQIMLNLLSNAVKFSRRDGKVRVSVACAAEGISIAVADNGIGIAAEDLPHALEPFAQIDGRLSRKYEGAGLGLPLSRRLMQLHGGTLSIESTPGTGTTVTIRFPAARRVAVSADTRGLLAA